ncbi:MAG: VOC family protein [Planctomycetota bacterium]|nr:VOC family protein [Planctomycetota bacterium]MDA1179067.1 VOC family protein [Planctomycetota bacterium]
MTLTVHSLDHVTLVSQDLARTRHFYVDILGMQRVARPEFDFPGDWFRAGKTLIHINVAGAEAGAPGAPSNSGTHPTRGHHIAFLVDDVEAAAQALREAGLAIVAGPRQRPDGGQQVYVHDPDGYLIELCTNPTR